MCDSEVYAYSKTETLASTLGKYILRKQDKALADGDSFKVAVSGGSLVKILRMALIDNEAIASQIHWEKWHVYFSDERLVPLHHADSNYKLFNDEILSKLTSLQKSGPEVFTINESLIHDSDSTTDAKIASEYESLLPKDSTFDLILLGLGPDGHTASLFPGHEALKESTKLITNVTDSPKPPPRRISFTLPLISKAKNVAFVAEGASKNGVIKQIFSTEESNLPGELVNELSGPEIRWFLSNDAVEGAAVIVSMFE